MISQPFARAGAGRRGFTLVELLVPLALIIFIMMILSQTFTDGIGTLRDLKALGDLDERIRAEAVTLRSDLDTTDLDAAAFVFDGLRTGSIDPDAAADLRKRYTTIATDAAALDAQLAKLELQATSPAEKLAFRRTRTALDQINTVATFAAVLLELIEEGGG